jgi:hypothetical protein
MPTEGKTDPEKILQIKRALLFWFRLQMFGKDLNKSLVKLLASMSSKCNYFDDFRPYVSELTKIYLCCALNAKRVS